MITILIPTRGRPSILQRSLKSIIDNASTIDNYEIILGIDNDDQNTIDTLKTFDFLKTVKHKIVFFDPLGYKQLHIYFNILAQHSTGDLLWVFPDDYEILTKDWDILLLQDKNELYIYPYDVNNNNWSFSLSPIISKKWYEITGRITNNSQTDLWVGHIAEDLNIIKKSSVKTQFFLSPDGGQHDSHNFYTRDKEEWEKDKAKITEYIKTKEENEKVSTNI